MADWFSLGTKNGVIKDREGRYLINVGCKIVNPDYPDSGKIRADEFDNYPQINVVLENKKTGETIIISCQVSNFKAHTYNKYPTEEHPVDNGNTASFHIDSGWVQTGIAYPYSWNASDGIPCSPINVDGSVIEFVGTDVDFPANEYRLKEVIVLNSN